MTQHNCCVGEEGQSSVQPMPEVQASHPGGQVASQVPSLMSSQQLTVKTDMYSLTCTIS